MGGRLLLARTVAMISIGAPLVAAVVDGWQGWPGGGVSVLYGPVGIAFAVAGWFIAERRSGNPIGLLLLFVGLAFGLYLLADAYMRLPGPPHGAALAGVFISTLDAPMLTVIALVLILFPDGRPPTARWRWVVPLSVVAMVAGVLGFGLQAGPLFLYPRFDNPIGIPGFPGEALSGLSYACMLVLLLAAVAALVERWRRGNALERAQIKWVGSAALLLAIAEIVNVATFRPDETFAITVVLTTFTLTLVPIAIGIAILRYRLYEIDRLVSRSIAYVAVTGILAIVFAGGILLLQEVLATFTQGQTVAVAATTLLVFALFQPVRRRVQSVVDHRFDRTRYDAERIAMAFSDRLRNETDMNVVTLDLERTTRLTVAPESLAIWLRHGPTTPAPPRP